MSSQTLKHLIYTSAARAVFEAAELKGILESAQGKNASLRVTGMLLHCEGSFFQVLEGEAETLNTLFAIIERDPRHARVTKIIDEPIAQRDFSNWTMGFAQASAADLSRTEGLSDFFQDGNSLANLQPGRAKKLLSAFADGRWRRGLARGAA